MNLQVFEQKSPAHNEFRSDTFTTPTLEMVQSICNTTLGDSVYNEDESTLKLERKVADIAGKEAALFCVSGTLSNQLGVRVNLLQPPHAVLCDHRSHIYVDEAGGLPTLSQAMIHPVAPKNGNHLTLEDDILPHFVPDDGEIHSCPTKLISLENTLHGMIFPLEEIKKISQFCKENNVRLHLDGARLWNASVETGISIKEYCSYFDSVSLCLSKSLGAPIGSVLVSDQRFINKANHFKKQNGGGIRQAGFICEMASTAIDSNFSKIKRSHEMAKELGKICDDNGIILEHPVHTNFVFLSFPKNKMSFSYMKQLVDKYGININSNRIAFHYQISDESFELCKKVVLECFEYSKSNPDEKSKNSAY